MVQVKTFVGIVTAVNGEYAPSFLIYRPSTRDTKVVNFLVNYQEIPLVELTVGGKINFVR